MPIVTVLLIFIPRVLSDVVLCYPHIYLCPKCAYCLNGIIHPVSLDGGCAKMCRMALDKTKQTSNFPTLQPDTYHIRDEAPDSLIMGSLGRPSWPMYIYSQTIDKGGLAGKLKVWLTACYCNEVIS